eukprot:TRINITY_DN3116_c0_g1_i13.p3 TRINITY_DN3116_c0_g1~~TRINITY_DN3116_c0_g1_i13.p3  ORF type:complete len:290 (+),score=16.59 TRINITY_DN3116_c0_g1_i13:212-1081(+)
MMLLFTTQVQMVLTNVELKSRQLEMETFAIFMLYVRSGSEGYPLNKECDGTGCVKAPDFPRGINTCWYERDEYCPEIQGLSGDFCTDSGVANAAAQLRHAIINDHCNCRNVTAPPPPPHPCPNCYCNGKPSFASGYTKADLLALDDNTLFNIGLGGINECRIVESPVGNGDFCDLYVKSGSDGYPLNQECQGIGCVKAPDFPRAINTCWYARDEFCPEIQGLSGDFCTDSGVANAAAQLRHAIKNDHCNCANLADTRPALVPIVSSDITPSPILTGFPFFPRRPLPWLP